METFLKLLLQVAYAKAINLPEASNIAPRVDALYDFIYLIGVISFFGTMGVMIYFVVRYRAGRKKKEHTAYILGHHGLEVAWTIIPLVFMLAIFAWAYRDFSFMRMLPEKPLEINVVGRQWLWNFTYANGRKTMNDLYVPLGQPVKLILTSEDVIHGFYVPNMRMKVDVVPGMFTYLSFEPTLVGDHPVFCSQYCGTAHSDMLGVVHVLEPADFKAWYDTGKVPANVATAVEQTKAKTAASRHPASLADTGKQLAAAKGCVACHTFDGSTKVGPSWKGVYGTSRELQGGSNAKADENYLREAIVDPQAKVVKGYGSVMPVFKGLLSDDEINALIAYIKSLK